MNVIVQGVSNLEPRAHPYEGEYDSRVRHYDFVRQPELIRQVLEDFKPWEKYEAVQDFYQLLEWINGPSRIFETSDCRLEAPKANPYPDMLFKKILFGRVMIFFRNWASNYADILANKRYFVSNDLQDLTNGLAAFLPKVHREAPVTFQIYCAPTYYRHDNELPSFGHQLMIQWNCWGDSDQGLFTNLSAGIDAIGGALKEAATETKAGSLG